MIVVNLRVALAIGIVRARNVTDSPVTVHYRRGGALFGIKVPARREVTLTDEATVAELTTSPDLRLLTERERFLEILTDLGGVATPPSVPSILTLSDAVRAAEEAKAIAAEALANAAGTVLRSGAGAPSNDVGSDGDYYLDTDTGDLYLRASGTYSVTGNLKGADGTNGADGADGIAIDDLDHVVYVNGDTGDDGNDGSIGSPVLTIDAALALLPYQWKRKKRIVFQADGTYAGPTRIDVGIPSSVNAEPYIWVGRFTTLLSGTTTGSSSTTVTDSGLSMTTNEHVGKFIRFTSGPASGERFTIKSNTATVITVKRPGFSPGPGTGAAFVIEEPSVIIEHSYLSVVGGGGGTSNGFNVGFHGILWQQTSFGVWTLTGAPAAVDGCIFDLNGAGGISSGALLSSQGLAIADVHDSFTGQTVVRNGFGGQYDIYITGGGCFNGDWFIRSAGLSYAGGGKSFSYYLETDSLITLEDGASAIYYDTVHGSYISVIGNSRLDMDTATVSGAPDDAISVTQRSYAKLANIAGGTNGGVGIHCGSGARIYMPGNTNTVTGTDGDTSVGDTVYTYAAIASADGVDDRSFARVDVNENP